MSNLPLGTTTDSPEITDTIGTITVYSLLMTVVLVSGLWIGTGLPVHFAEVSGTSMEPTFVAGDVLIGVESDSVETGDVVIVKDDACFSSEYVVHRVVDVTEDGYVTQGDNNPIADQGQAGCDALSESAITAEIMFHL